MLERNYPNIGNKALVFLHIPKTGGTSLHNMLVGYYEKSEVCPERFNNLDKWDQEQLKSFRYFSGHYDRHQVSLIPREKFIITMLREPKSRILSLYYFWRAHRHEAIEKNNLGGPRIAKRLSLIDFLRYANEGIPGNIDNILCRSLIGKLYVGPNREYLFPDDEVVDRAKAALDSFDAFGVVEHVEQSFGRIFSKLGLPAPDKIPHERDHRSFANQPNLEFVEKEEITPDIEAELDRLTDKDRILYGYALEKFSKNNARTCSDSQDSSGGLKGFFSIFKNKLGPKRF
ncbi:MAG TPA: sulfotransferase family 2 domain-containing protein [Candidatus Competibacteraceae bacterium]|nr:sulfotransferase family 2 domain-containing protein [Candidatus Competibacteraceae bacterium]